MDVYLSQGYYYYVKMQKALSRIWTKVVMSISYGNNHFTISNLYPYNQ